MVEAQPVGGNAELPRVFLFDEIRGSAKWDRWLKQAVDARVGRIVATDSAAGLLRAGAVESVEEEWDEILIEGLTFRELISFMLRLTRMSGSHASYPSSSSDISLLGVSLVTF